MIVKEINIKNRAYTINVRLMTWRNIFKQPKSCEKGTTRWWDWCMSEDEKKRNKANFQ